MFCGEALTVDAAVTWSRAAPNSAVINNYGPTELTMFCTAFTFRSDHPVEGAYCSHRTPRSRELRSLSSMPLAAQPIPVSSCCGALRCSTATWTLVTREMAFIGADAPGGRWYRTGDLVKVGR